MRKSRKRRVTRKTVKEQVRDVKAQGLPNPVELAGKIAGSGSTPEEILGWLGAVLSRAGMAAPPSVEAEVEVAEEVPMPAPPPSPAAIEERFENELLNALLKEINRSTRRRK